MLDNIKDLIEKKEYLQIAKKYNKINFCCNSNEEDKKKLEEILKQNNVYEVIVKVASQPEAVKKGCCCKH